MKDDILADKAGTRLYASALVTSKQLLFCPYGRIQLLLENRNGREEIELSDPEKLIHLMIANVLADKSLPVYGESINVRD